jgi:galactokinase
MPNSVSSFAPGRVELLGNHTDYNYGVVLSAAIDQGITVSASLRTDKLIEVKSQTNGRSVQTSLPITAPQEIEQWANYPLGVVKMLGKEGCPLQGMDLQVDGDLPLGAGLSSSAAFEVATAYTLCSLYDFSMAPMALAQLCRRAENEFVGVRSGLLDQASSIFGRFNELIFLDFRAVSVETIPLPPGLGLLITDSGVPHELTGGEYNQRFKECMEAARLLGVASLREASSAQVREVRIDPVLSRRALHITGENERVQQGVAALRAQDLESFGQLMFESHASSQKNFENSTSHLDALVEIAKEQEGVLGSRLSGGGFGGSTISLIREEHASTLIAAISREYTQRTGAVCKPILTKASQGARVL